MNRWKVVLVCLCCLGAVLAFRCRFVQDDAFISFHYARNLVEGAGLTWFGDTVEGYTSFLWVLWMALGISSKVEPILWSYIGSIASFLVVIVTTWLLCHNLCRDYLTSSVATLMLVTNYTVLCYATGGLETMLQTALVCTAMWVVYGIRGIREAPGPARLRLLLLSLALALALMTRLDSAVFCVIIAALAVANLIRARAPLLLYVCLVAPAALLVSSWLIWKLAYYGRILPNTYYAKLSHEFGWNGLLQLWRFAHWYLLWPILLVGISMRVFWARPPRLHLWPLWLSIIAWLLYVAYIGGDFMEFRILVPITPLLFICLACLMRSSLASLRPAVSLVVTIAVLLVIMGASFHHAKSFTGTTQDDALDSIQTLSTFYGLYQGTSWDAMGNVLAQRLAHTDVVLGLYAVGAIPFYSRLKTIDMYGLNDTTVALHGDPVDEAYRRPGHRVQARLSHLRQRQVNLVIGHPRVVPRGVLRQPRSDSLCRSFLRTLVSSRTEPIDDAAVVLMPLSRRRGLLMWYLTPHPGVEERILRGDWEVKRLRHVRFGP